MELLARNQLIEMMSSKNEDSLFIDPLLDHDQQIGDVTIDLRLGYDFLVSILTRNSSVDLLAHQRGKERSLESYFQKTRREVGDRFLLYPGQVVLTTTLEYLCLPSNVYADLLSRSSYTRLGIHINTMVQPGFRGCAPLELFNHGNNAIELVVGSRICQARFFKVVGEYSYIQESVPRKYYGDVRPVVSKADRDVDLNTLARIAGRRY